MITQPSSPSTRSIVAAAGGAPAVSTRIPRGAPRLASAGAFAIPMSTVGAAHSVVIRSAAMRSKTARGSTLRRQTWTPPAAVTVQTKVQPLAWNMGRVHRYRSAQVILKCSRVPTTFRWALRWVIITPLGREVVPLV